MRTVDPEAWCKINETKIERPIFGSQSVTKLENRLRRSFVDAMKDFWANCSIEGVKYMRESKMPRIVRRCYVVFILLLSLCGVLALLHVWTRIRGAPSLVVSLLTAQHSVRRLDFPAVALCSQSVLSKAAIRKYASYLYSLDINGTYSLEDLESKMLVFGALVTWTSPPVDVAFSEYIARVSRETNVTNIIMKLTPQCTSFLKRCSWRAARVPCDRLFALRATPRGYCCVFNSRYQDEDLHNPIQNLHFVGQDFGLSLVVNEDVNDVAFVRGPGEGLEVILFDGSEYPLLEGGSARLYLTQRNASAFFKLSAMAQSPAANLQYYTETWRGCRMRMPRSRSTARRGRAWCLAACRRRAVRSLCGCVPHLLLPPRGEPVCSPDQLACLNKHKEKFTNFYPGDAADPSLTEEASDSLDCKHCVPDCGRLAYSAAISYAPYQFTDKLFLNYFVQGVSLVNTTVIRIFYTSEDQHLYILEANLRWFEVVGYFCSQWLCMVAVTLVSVAEVLYYGTVRWGHHYVRRLRAEGTRKKQLTPPLD